MIATAALSPDDCRRDPAFAAVKDAVVGRTGMAFYRDRDEALARAVAARISALALPGCGAYHRHLAGHGNLQEWDTLIDEVTIGETYFFRYPAQFDALRETVIPDLVEQRRAKRSLRIWSAGCASGPEAYSLAILLRLDLPHLVAGWDISIVGTDISRGKLARAAAGNFTNWELRQLSQRYRDSCFDRVGDEWRLRDGFRRDVTFRHHNLLDPGPVETFDLILCRNVMIYFDADTIRKLTRALHQSLAEDGWLVLGHAEPHLEIVNVFQPWALSEATLYRKRPDRRLPTQWAPPVMPAPADVKRPNEIKVQEEIKAQDRALPPDVVASAEPLRAAEQPDHRAAALMEARHHANAGDWPTATALCQRLLDRDPLDADAHYLLALVRGHQGDRLAAESLQRALYIDRSFALAHYQLGRHAIDLRDFTTARRSLRNVLSVLAPVSDADPVRAGEGLTAGELRELALLQIQHIGAWP